MILSRTWASVVPVYGFPMLGEISFTSAGKAAPNNAAFPKMEAVSTAPKCFA